MRGVTRTVNPAPVPRTFRSSGRFRAGAILVGSLMLTSALAAQDPDTRAAELLRQREQKAAALQPYRPTGTERVLLWLENSRSWERLLNPPEGIYPKIGTITPGSGLSFGVGYRKPGLFNDRAAFSSVVMGSFKSYWLADARLGFPELAGGRVFADLFARAYDHQSEAFFGVGPQSRRDAESYYGFRNTIAGGRVGSRLGPLTVDGGVEYFVPDVDRGRRSIAVQDRFAAGDAPGVERQPNFGRYFASVQVNTRDPRGNPRVGGLYALRYERFDDLKFNAYNFGRVEAEVQQYLSLFNQRRVLALRGRVSSARAGQGQQVPFYLQQTLGGPDDLRGFRRHRLRDDHLLLLQAEYRWEVFTAMDAALFGDWGQVAARAKDLNLRNLEHDYGAGVRFGTDHGVFLRIEGAFGSRDGKHFVFRFGDVF